jgi:dienelactone hydrolase
MTEGFQKPATRWICVVLLLLLLGIGGSWGCSLKPGPPVWDPIERPEIAYFQYEKEAIQPDIERVEDRKGYWIEKIVFPSSMDGAQVTGYSYHPKSVDTGPIILIIPVLGGSYFFSENTAQYLVRQGFRCIRFERTADPLDAEKGLLHTERVLRHAIIDLRRTIDWLIETDPGVKNRIGVMGVSMGAIVTTLAIEVEPRIGPATIILGGGDIATILATSREGRVVRFREGVMAAEGWTIEAFHKKARQLMAPVDPLTYASRVNPTTVLMANGRYDTTIPYHLSEKLWEAMGKPRWIRTPTGHYSTVVYLPYLQHQAYLHFRDFFGE